MEYKHNNTIVNTRLLDFITTDTLNWEEIDTEDFNDSDLEKLYEKYLIYSNKKYNYSNHLLRNELQKYNRKKIESYPDEFEIYRQNIASADSDTEMIPIAKSAYDKFKEIEKKHLINIDLESRFNDRVSNIRDKINNSEYSIAEKQLNHLKLEIQNLKPYEDSILFHRINDLEKFIKWHYKFTEEEKKLYSDRNSLIFELQKIEETKDEINTILDQKIKLEDELEKNNALINGLENKYQQEREINIEIKEFEELKIKQKKESEDGVNKYLNGLKISSKLLEQVINIFYIYKYEIPEKIDRKYLIKIGKEISDVFELLIKETYISNFYKKYIKDLNLKTETEKSSGSTLHYISKNRNISLESFYRLINENLNFPEAKFNDHILNKIKNYFIEELASSNFLKEIRNITYKSKSYYAILNITLLRRDAVHPELKNFKYNREEIFWYEDLNNIIETTFGFFNIGGGLLYPLLVDFLTINQTTEYQYEQSVTYDLE